ncbi:MAG: type II toxin-antitoxin system RelE/ParE family toxin [Proteobacteria bacterium]|nr:type II toxin-antitoxin system RelE/ParE family toxin [Pseudomonadota bacterium]
MRIEYHPETVNDLNAAILFYDEQLSGLGIEFRTEIYETIERIIADPHLHRVIRSDIRRCFVHRFPFSILYRIVDNDLLRILVIRHHRRHPEFGIQRNET